MSEVLPAGISSEPENMGLDALDIVFQIEKTFGFTVKRELLMDLAKDGEITVGDLYNLILSELGLQDLARNSFGVNMYIWTESRRALQSVTHVPLEEIEMQTPLATLFPTRVRQFSWETLRRSFRYQIKELDYPVYLRWIGLALAAGMVAVDQLQLWQLPKAAWLWPILGLFGLWMVSETYLKVCQGATGATGSALRQCRTRAAFLGRGAPGYDEVGFQPTRMASG